MVWKLTGALALLLCLSGCVFDDVDKMYTLPESSEIYVTLQTRINEEKGSAEYIAPLGGENRQTIQLVDVDGDGGQEAVAFFRDENAENPLKIVIFKQNDQEDYQVYARIEGIGTEIEFIDYLNLCGDDGADILVSWQVSGSVHTLSGYSVAGGQPVELLRTNYGRCMTADLDDDGRQELALAQMDPAASAPWRIEYYDGGESKMELISATPLSVGATDISDWNSGTLSDGAPALFVTSYFGKDTRITDVLCVREEGLQNISLAGEGEQSPNTFRPYGGVHPRDIDGDGSTDLPVARAVDAYGSSASETFWWMDWFTWASDGSRDLTLTTYHSQDGWYLELPGTWQSGFAMSREENTDAGVRSVIFARRPETAEPAEEPEAEEAREEIQPKPFLIISTLTGAERGELANRSDRFILSSDNTTIYTGEFLDGWDCGLSQEDLKTRFFLSGGSWSYTR